MAHYPVMLQNKISLSVSEQDTYESFYSWQINMTHLNCLIHIQTKELPEYFVVLNKRMLDISI